MPQDYDATVNLPKTDFPMRAGLPKREPGMLEEFGKKKIYEKLMRKNEGKPLYILHDGPPYANGDIHIGTALNKILKDFIVRYKNMTGFRAPYVPGWDTHGLPIESAILKSSGLKRDEMSTVEFRNRCRQFALGFLDRQRGEFKRLGVIGDWENPYMTLDPSFEAEQVKVFGAMAEKGYIYKGLKPVYWCPHDETALAEAEIEYADDRCDSIYVKFRVSDDLGKLGRYTDLDSTYFVIWTTTAWTLPGNLAVCLNGKFEYVLAKAGSETYIVAKELLGDVMKKAGIDSWEVLVTLRGGEFEHMKAEHPFCGRLSAVLLGEHVTLDAGTGCVHTAPGHGMEDFEVCRKYDEEGKTKLGVVVPVNSRGVMTSEAGEFAGLYYEKANAAILERLRDGGALFARETLIHPYPHCWRCKNPVIYRATEQWFASVDAIKQQAVDACEGISWYPEWGRERMISMIRERSDWCISRQRSWGVPIPIFYCGGCGVEIVDRETIEFISRKFEELGSNCWYELEAKELMPEGYRCPACGGQTFTKEKDIMDVWFDSGSSHAAVLAKRPELRWPADLYLEGGDQYRGWFQSSMLTAIASRGAAPYRIIITHGWAVDGEGKAMHKSVGNTIAPEEIIKDYGADLLRLWVASSDYRQDMRISKDILKQLSDSYLKIRNTARYILGNLNGFDPESRTPFEAMEELDRWAVVQYNRLVKKARAHYDAYEFHPVYHAVHNFCTVEMSSFYLDVIKDRLYCDRAGGALRKSAQSAVYLILDGLVRLLAPILAFTAEEIWAAMPHHRGADAESVLYNDMPDCVPEYAFGAGREEKWDRILALRSGVNKALELARADKLIGKPLDAKITLCAGGEARTELETLLEEDLRTLFIVSEVELAPAGDGMACPGFEGVTVRVAASEAPRCTRCWTHDPTVGETAGRPELCARCAQAVSGR